MLQDLQVHAVRSTLGKRLWKTPLHPHIAEACDDDELAAEANSANPPAKVPKAGGADVAGMERQMRDTKLSSAAQAWQQAAPRSSAAPAAKGYGQHSPEVAAAAKRQVRNKAGNFELSLDSSTLLARRGKKGPQLPAPSGMRQETTVQ
ncbi:MAPK-activated protein kinase Srk1 [Elasticomyces elasticus]|nr:MAPK-activated protein kinase Srk1 [Elasticomyces elasticus]